MKPIWDFHEWTDFANNLKKGSLLEAHIKQASKDISKVLLKWIKTYTPVESSELIQGWDGNNFLVTKNGTGFEVLLVNRTPYALYVNDGHRSYNQCGGPYKIKKRVKVKSPHQWQDGDPTWYVFGHFFVERGILQLSNTKQIESIIMRELRKWWDSV